MFRRMLALLLLALPATAGAQAIVPVGEILVMEGDDLTVGADSAIDGDNIAAIQSQFYSQYDDEFDMISIWTSFPDLANGGAYFTSAVQSPLGFLKGFINMNQVGFWTGFDALNTLGQEFGHYWLVFNVPNQMIGRDGSHWSSVCNTNGSVMDGVNWTDNGDGTFTAGQIMTKFGDLDLWFMGYIADDEVGDIWCIEGSEYSPTAIWEGLGNGAVATGTRIDITLDQVKGVSGPMPPIDMRQKDFRVAFILVTAPGETADMVTGQVAEIEEIRQGWNEIYGEWTLGRGTMCTDTTGPCPISLARFDAGRVREGTPSDMDGVLEPGEQALIEVDWRNTGTAPTVGAQAMLEVGEGFSAPAPVEIETINPGEVKTTTFALTVPSSLACGQEYVFTAVASTEARSWEGSVSMVPGIEEGTVETFATDAGWRGNLDMMDTAAMTGRWDYGPAELTTRAGYVLQPQGGHGGTTDSAWWTGRRAGFDWLANDVDTGKTSLVSAPFDLSGLNEPKLRYYVWYTAMDFAITPPVPSEGDDLVVEASRDGGATWVEIDRVNGASKVWEQRTADVNLSGDLSSVTFRFTAADEGTAQNLVEVGIDDVQIVAFSASCGGGGCGCRVGPAPEDGASRAAAVAVLVGLAFLGGRRIRRRR